MGWDGSAAATLPRGLWGCFHVRQFPAAGAVAAGREGVDGGHGLGEGVAVFAVSVLKLRLLVS